MHNTKCFWTLYNKQQCTTFLYIVLFEFQMYAPYLDSILIILQQSICELLTHTDLDTDVYT